MNLFHKKDQYKGYNIYSMKKYVDKKRIIFTTIIVILIIITLGFIIYYSIDTTIRLANAKRFEQKLIEYESNQEELQKQEKERQAKIPKLTDEGKQNIKGIYKSETKRVFLTFDDGPSVNTADVLDILKSNDIKATFFVLGTQVEKMPEMVKRAYQEGHYIANHGYSHQYSQIYSSPETVLQEFNQCNSAVAKAIDVPEYNSHLFRFPGGSVGGKYANLKAEAVTLLEQNNIMHVDWNALTGDAEKSSPDEEYLMNNLQKTTQNKNSIVILMHDAQAKRVTVEFLPKLIEFFQQQGYQFENFYSIIK